MTVIRETLDRVRIGEPERYASLTLFPLLGDKRFEAEPVTLDEAIEQGWFEVSEISAQGSVPELKVVNRGDRAVFLLDGEELQGAKQNRVLNLTILVPAGATLIVPVSCVEQGRWANRSYGMSTSKAALYSMARAAKLGAVSESYARRRRPTSDQRALWDLIARKTARLGVRSETLAMADLFEDQGPRLDDYERAFAAREGQVGAIFAIGPKVVGLELFGGTELLTKLLPKIVRSYALDAIEQERSEQAPDEVAARRFLDDVADGRTEGFPAVGLGEDVRIRGSRLSGAALLADERIVHLCAFREEGEREETETGSGSRGRILRASQRRTA